MACTLAIVVNANADRGAIMGRPLSRLRRALGAGERLFVSRSHADVEEIAAELVRQGLPPVALVGGDGTLTRTLSALNDRTGGAMPPRVVLLRGGTMNTIADAMGVPGGAPDALLRRYRNARGEGGRSYHTLSLDGRVGFLFSAGLMHAFLQAYYEQPLGTGMLGASALLASGVVSAAVGGPLAQRLSARVDLEMVVDGVAHARTDYLFVGAGTVAQVGLGFRPYGRAGAGVAGFHLLGYRGRIGGLARWLPHFARGRGAEVPDTLDCLAHSVCLTASEGRIPYSLDGELYVSDGPLHIAVGPALCVYP